MCDCWLIDRAATPIASTGGALARRGTTSRASTATDHGQRAGLLVWATASVGSLTTSTTANTQRQPRAAREAGALEHGRALGEPVLGQRAAGVADALEPVSAHAASMARPGWSGRVAGRASAPRAGERAAG